MGEQQRTLEKAAGDRTAGQARLEQRVAELASRMESEAAARAMLTEETEQLIAASRAKTRQLISEQAEAARQACEALERNLLGQLEKESSLREAQQEGMRGALSE